MSLLIVYFVCPLSVNHNVEPTQYAVWIQTVYFSFPIIQNARCTVWCLCPLKQDSSNSSSRAICWLRQSTVELGYNVTCWKGRDNVAKHNTELQAYCLIVTLWSVSCEITVTYLLTKLLTAWRFVLEILGGFELVEKYPRVFWGPKFHCRIHKIRPPVCFLIDANRVHAPFPLPEVPLYYYPPTYACVLQVVSFTQFSPPKPYILLSSFPYVLRAPPFSFSLIWSPE